MTSFIRKNLKKASISVSLALAITVIFAILRAKKIIPIECTVQYLNPWQLFFQCSLFYGVYYFIVFALSFLIIFFVLKKFKLAKE